MAMPVIRFTAPGYLFLHLFHVDPLSLHSCLGPSLKESWGSAVFAVQQNYNRLFHKTGWSCSILSHQTHHVDLNIGGTWSPTPCWSSFGLHPCRRIPWHTAKQKVNQQWSFGNNSPFNKLSVQGVGRSQVFVCTVLWWHWYLQGTWM